MFITTTPAPLSAGLIMIFLLLVRSVIACLSRLERLWNLGLVDCSLLRCEKLTVAKVSMLWCVLMGFQVEVFLKSVCGIPSGGK